MTTARHRAVLGLGPETTGHAFHPTLARLREQGPVHRAVLPDGSLVWLVTRHADVRAALADPRLSLSKRNAKGWRGFGLPPVLDANLLNMDPPEHTRIRRLVAPAFGPRRLERLRPRIEAIAGDLLAAMAPAGEGDLVAAYAAPLPLVVICELLGIPAGDRAHLRAWNLSMMTGAPDAAEAMDRIVALLVALIRRKRVSPGEDVLSALVAARDRDDRLSEDELTSLAFLLLVAGHEDPTNLIGSAALALCREPGRRDALRADPGLVGSAVEELLRYDTSAAVAPRRFPVEDLEIGGVTIRAGEPVLLVLSSANRDPRRHAAPDELTFGTTTRHLSFGHGVHQCLGAGLARLEVGIAVGAMVRELPGLRLAVPESELTWMPSFRVRGLSRLPVRWDTGGGRS